MLAPLLVLAAALGAPPPAKDPEIAAGLGLIERLEYDRAVVVLGRALTRPELSREDRLAAMEALAFAYTVLDDRVHGEETFCELLDVEPEYTVASSRSPRLRDAFAAAREAWRKGRKVGFTIDPAAPDLAGALSGDPRRVGAVVARADDGEAVKLVCTQATCRGPRPAQQFRVEILDHRGALLATAGPFDGGGARPGEALLPWWGWVAIGVGTLGMGAIIAAAASPGEPPTGTLGRLELP